MHSFFLVNLFRLILILPLLSANSMEDFFSKDNTDKKQYETIHGSEDMLKNCTEANDRIIKFENSLLPEKGRIFSKTLLLILTYFEQHPPYNFQGTYEFAKEENKLNYLIKLIYTQLEKSNTPNFSSDVFPKFASWLCCEINLLIFLYNIEMNDLNNDQIAQNLINWIGVPKTKLLRNIKISNECY